MVPLGHQQIILVHPAHQQMLANKQILLVHPAGAHLHLVALEMSLVHPAHKLLLAHKQVLLVHPAGAHAHGQHLCCSEEKMCSKM